MMLNNLYTALNTFAQGCRQSFLGFPHWTRDLSLDSNCNIKNFALGDIWQIVANITQMALQLAGILAVVFIIIGGIKFITSQGNPEQVQNAKSTIATAIGGLILAILAITIVNFIAGRI